VNGRHAFDSVNRGSGMPGIATQEKMAMEQKRSSDADQQENTMRLQKPSFAAMGLAGALAGFAGISVVQAENADMTYKAELSPLNSKTTGSEARGEATFTISGDQLTIHVSAKGVSPNMEHLQHLHGFAKGDRKAKCPAARNDRDGDGIIDLIEPNRLQERQWCRSMMIRSAWRSSTTPTRPQGRMVPIHTRRRFPSRL
jgi:hypothetical protein